MLRRLYFPLVILFWITMNALLWRFEMSSRGGGGSAVPVGVVWGRILTAPDASSLEILRDKQRLGHCRWAADVTSAETGSARVGDDEIEGRVGQLAGYTLELDGNVLVGETPPRLRFTWQAEIGTNQAWRQMNFKLNTRPSTLEVRANAADRSVVIRRDNPETAWERKIAFDELANPDALFAKIGVPMASVWLKVLAPDMELKNLASLDLGLNWEARSDWLVVGNARLRVYRLQARIFDKYKAVVYVSRVGEIMRVELPGDVLLVNEELANLAF